MLGICSRCKQDVGFFGLLDRLCVSCRADCLPANRQGSTTRVLASAPWSSGLYILGVVAHIILLVSGASAEQALLSIGLMLAALSALAVTWVLRFLLIRRQVPMILAVPIWMPNLIVFAVANQFSSGSGLALTTIGFVLLPYFVMRVPNLAVPDEAISAVSAVAE